MMWLSLPNPQTALIGLPPRQHLMSLLLRMTTTAGQVGAPALSGSEMAFLTPHSCKSSKDFQSLLYP